MGRPINKRYFGVLGSATTPHIPVEAAGFANKDQITEDSSADVYILKQKSSRKFLVKHAEDGDEAICKLVDKAYDDSTNIVAGEMVIVGYINGSQKVRLRELTNRIATDFNSVRYKWSLSDDSSTTILILTTM
jgi:hypothetical protein